MRAAVSDEIARFYGFDLPYHCFPRKNGGQDVLRAVAVLDYVAEISLFRGPETVLRNAETNHVEVGVVVYRSGRTRCEMHVKTRETCLADVGNFSFEAVNLESRVGVVCRILDVCEVAVNRSQLNIGAFFEFFKKCDKRLPRDSLPVCLFPSRS